MLNFKSKYIDDTYNIVDTPWYLSFLSSHFKGVFPAEGNFSKDFYRNQSNNLELSFSRNKDSNFSYPPKVKIINACFKEYCINNQFSENLVSIKLTDPKLISNLIIDIKFNKKPKIFINVSDENHKAEYIEFSINDYEVILIDEHEIFVNFMTSNLSIIGSKYLNK